MKQRLWAPAFAVTYPEDKVGLFRGGMDGVGTEGPQRPPSTQVNHAMPQSPPMLSVRPVFLVLWSERQLLPMVLLLVPADQKLGNERGRNPRENHPVIGHSLYVGAYLQSIYHFQVCIFLN